MGNAGVGGVVSLPTSTPLSISGTRGLYSALVLLYRGCWNQRHTRMRRSTKNTHKSHTHMLCVPESEAGGASTSAGSCTPPAQPSPSCGSTDGPWPRFLGDSESDWHPPFHHWTGLLDRHRNKNRNNYYKNIIAQIKLIQSQLTESVLPAEPL